MPVRWARVGLGPQEGAEPSGVVAHRKIPLPANPEAVIRPATDRKGGSERGSDGPQSLSTQQGLLESELKFTHRAERVGEDLS